MRLLFVSRAYYPAIKYGGPVTSLRNLCSLLVQAGHDVTVVCSNMASPGPRGERLPPGLFEIDRVSVHFLPVSIGFHWEGLVNQGPKVLGRELARTDVAHIAGTRHFLGVNAEFLARRKGVPYLTMPEGSIPPRSRNVLAKQAFDAVYTRRSLSRAFRVIATSPGEAQDLSSWGIGPEHILILPPRPGSITPSRRTRSELRLERKIPPDAPVLLWMGRMHGEKGLPLLLQAIADPRLKAARLLLAGAAEDPNFEASLHRRARQLGVDDRVEFLGWVDGELQGELMNLADLFVFPSRKENFGLAAAEAVVSGLPVIVTRGCGIAPLVADKAGLVCEYEASSLADAVARVLGDEQLLKRLQAGTAEVTSSLKWAPVVENLENVYSAALHRRRATLDEPRN